ncbi:MAG: hypothetical protein P1U54_08395 [Immundisolibacteraceae bacterium]|nr:hypothetical protein [Immundisolibacteraceae bacterium]
MSRAELNQDPTTDDYFNTDHLTNFSDALVRESIQNSLDAKSSKTAAPVKVRITFPSEKDLMTNADLDHIFAPLYLHANATGIVKNAADPKELVSYIVIEDFGTKGLAGSPDAADDPDLMEDSDFYYFWRNVGRGRKHEEARGRWGLGKTMFPASSLMHSFFGLTVRESDQRHLLMGQSVLKIHHVDDRKYAPYGYYGVEDPEDGFVVPIEDSISIDEFKLYFSLSRNTEPGLSVVVPFPKDDIESNDVIKSVIEHYFFPILSDELIVEILVNGKPIIINRETIDDIAKTYFGENDLVFSGTAELAKWYLEQNQSTLLKAELQLPHKSPIWSDDLFDQSLLSKLTNTLDMQKPIAVRVPLYVIPTGQDPIVSHFDLVLERDPDLNQPLDVFLRSGITISGVHSLREHGIRALVISQDKALVTMLGDSENPAHTEWQDRSRNFVGKYRAGKSTLAFVKDAPRGFLRLLNRQSEVIDDTALRHIFPEGPSGRESPRTEDQAEGQSSGKQGPGKQGPPTPKIPKQQKKFILSQRSGGFEFHLSDYGLEKLPLNIKVSMAYDVRRGNPFKRWKAADFDVSENALLIEVNGGDILRQKKNEINLKIDSKKFIFKVTGFDPERDLIVDLIEERW